MQSWLKVTTVTCLAAGVLVACLTTSHWSANAETDLTWKTPVNIVTPSQIDLPTLQRAFDEYSWQLLTSLNWPANPDGSPDTSTTMGVQDAPGVWQFWKGTYLYSVT